jgi:hypothetical protein
MKKLNPSKDIQRKKDRVKLFPKNKTGISYSMYNQLIKFHYLVYIEMMKIKREEQSKALKEKPEEQSEIMPVVLFNQLN